jgi:hypothetical protein
MGGTATSHLPNLIPHPSVNTVSVFPLMCRDAVHVMGGTATSHFVCPLAVQLPDYLDAYIAQPDPAPINDRHNFVP